MTPAGVLSVIGMLRQSSTIRFRIGYDIVSAEKNPGVMVALVILAVTVTTAVMAIGMWRMSKDTERAEKNARYRRKVLLRMALLYVFSAVFGTVEVARGKEPMGSLVGLPIVAFLAWMCWRLAAGVKVPPK